MITTTLNFSLTRNPEPSDSTGPRKLFSFRKCAKKSVTVQIPPRNSTHAPLESDFSGEEKSDHSVFPKNDVNLEKSETIKNKLALQSDLKIPGIGDISKYAKRADIKSVLMLSDGNDLTPSVLSAETLAVNTDRKLKIVKTDVKEWNNNDFPPKYKLRKSKITYKSFNNQCLLPNHQDEVLKKQYSLIIGKSMICCCFGERKTCGGIKTDNTLKLMEGVSKQLKPVKRSLAILTGNSCPGDNKMNLTVWLEGKYIVQCAVEKFNKYNRADNLRASYWEKKTVSGRTTFGLNIFHKNNKLLTGAAQIKSEKGLKCFNTTLYCVWRPS